jgi:hypothetical protein
MQIRFRRQQGTTAMSDELGSPAGLPVRMNFFEGQLLRAEDLRTEQDYHRQMRCLHNRLLHGWGIVDGYGVEDDGGTVLVGPGVAIDSLGRELVLPESARIELPPEAAVAQQTLWYLLATWEEIPSAPVAVREEVAFSRWIERCAISISASAPDHDGRALLLAALTVAAGDVASIDTSGRRPLLAASPSPRQAGS